MKTTIIKKENIKHDWHLIDASKKPLGRISTEIASLLLGKHKVNYTPRMVCGDKVVVINAKNLVLTGKKSNNKKYFRHSGFADGFKERNVKYYLDKNPAFIVRNAVEGMLPKNKLRDKLLKNLYIYEGSEHSHEAQLKNK